MQASQRRVFYYHADASPFGGHFTRPTKQVAPGHGSTSLPQAGGHASARVSAYRLDTLVSFDQAYSEIFGSENEANDSWSTQVTSTVEGLNIYDTVMADRVVANLSVEHPRDGGHPKVTVVGSQIDNLRINGVKVNPVMTKTLITPHQKGKFPDRTINEDQDFVARAVGQSQKLSQAGGDIAWLKERYGWVQSDEARKRKGYVLCSLVDEVQGAKPEHSAGHVIHVPEFGNVFLSELLTDHHTFRLTMIRVEMGCPVEGTMSVGTSDSNGSTMP
jgi:hypothetical protein